MNKIGQPSTGQPLDVDYISSIINTVDAIVDEINRDNTTATYYLLENGASGNSTGQLKIFSKRVPYNITAGNSAINVQVDYSAMAFSFVPVISVTVENSNISNIVSTIKSTSTTSSSIDVYNLANTNATAGVINVTAIGYSIV
jgi:hypothetical protein